MGYVGVAAQGAAGRVHAKKRRELEGQSSIMATNDPTLEEIRARRLAELQAQYGGGVRYRIRLAQIFNISISFCGL